MASAQKLVCLFFLITALLSLQTHARDSQFFSKVTRNRDTTTNPNNNYYKNKENEATTTLTKQEEQEETPEFIPQTTETGYGLYGHETGLDAPSTTTTNTPLYNMDNHNYENENNYKNYYNNNNENNHETNYAPELKGMSETSYTKVAPSKYFSNNNYNNGEGKYYAGSGYNANNGVVEKQGMSDTRYLEGGRYHYDINAEKKFDPNNNYMSYSNNYNKVGQNYGNMENNHGEYYRNNYNNNYNGNGMQQEYQNQFPEEEEFDFDDQP